MILANLATHIEDPIERLEIIRRSVQNSKQRFSRMTANEILNYSAVVYGPAGLNIASGMLPKRQALNITMTSYLDKLEVGLIACRNALPKMQNLLTHLEEEIQRFELAISELPREKVAN